MSDPVFMHARPDFSCRQGGETNALSSSRTQPLLIMQEIPTPMFQVSCDQQNITVKGIEDCHLVFWPRFRLFKASPDFHLPHPHRTSTTPPTLKIFDRLDQIHCQNAHHLHIPLPRRPHLVEVSSRYHHHYRLRHPRMQQPMSVMYRCAKRQLLQPTQPPGTVGRCSHQCTSRFLHLCVSRRELWRRQPLRLRPHR